MTVYDRLFLPTLSGPAKHIVLLDPEKLDAKKAARYGERCSELGVDALFIGGSTGDRAHFEAIAKEIKTHTTLPVLLFPGSADQIIPHADAVLFMSLLSGRNPRFLVDEPLRGVSAVRQFGLETIGMGYLLVESDRPSAVERVSMTSPLPRTDIENGIEHALLAQYFGMKVVYLEGGSGVGLPVPVAFIEGVKSALTIPLIVGGGLRTPEMAAERVKAGADLIVTGNVLEKEGMEGLLKELVDATHGGRSL